MSGCGGMAAEADAQMPVAEGAIRSVAAAQAHVDAGESDLAARRRSRDRSAVDAVAAGVPVAEIADALAVPTMTVYRWMARDARRRRHEEGT